MALALSRFRPPWLRRSLRRFNVMPRTLFGRSLLIVVLPILILQLVLTKIFYDRHWDSVSRWLSGGVAGEVAWLAEQLDAAPDDAARRLVLDGARAHLGLTLSLEPDGLLEPATARSGFRPPDQIDALLQLEFDRRLQRPFRIDTRPDDQLQRVAVYVQLDGALLRVLAPRKRVDSSTTTTFMAWMVATSALLVVVAIYFLSRQLRPIRRLAHAADSFGKGRDVGDVKLEGAIEVRRAALAYNRMRRRIVRHLAQRTELLAAVSHDLSTPLTRMNLELELIGAGPIVPADLEGLRADVAEMRRLVDAYLAFARAESQETMQTVPLDVLLEGVRARAARNRQDLTLTVVETGPITVRPVGVQRMLANLLDNAAKYARHVELVAWVERDLVAFDIHDDGPGIPAADRDKVFEPFVRLDGARRGDTGGIGMGLTIARDVAVQHGGSIVLGESRLGGLLVQVRLPQ